MAEEGSAVTYTADPRVDAYIDALPDWQQAICRQVRDLSTFVAMPLRSPRPGGWRGFLRVLAGRGEMPEIWRR